MHSTKLSFVLVACMLAAARCESDYDPLLLQIGPVDQPGAKLRLSTTGLAYVREIAMRVVNREIPKLKFPTVTTQVTGTATGTVTISNMHVLDYWPPTEYHLDMLPPDKFSWTTIDTGIRVAGDFVGNTKISVVPLNAKGQFDALIPHIANSLTIQLGVSNDFYPTVKAVACSFVVDSVDIQLSGSDMMIQVLNVFKSMISGQVKPSLQKQVCDRLIKMVDVDVNKMLATLPLKIPLSATRINPSDNSTSAPSTARFLRRVERAVKGFDYVDYPTSGSAKKSEPPISVKINENEYKNVSIESLDFDQVVNKIRSKDLILDLRMKKTPEIALGHAVTTHFGEISWEGKGGTPFHPAKIDEVAVNGSQMLQLYVSDYVANSLLYHAYKHGILKIGVTSKDSANLDHVLRTTCLDTVGVCIGDLLTDVSQAFPQHAVDLDLTPTQAPSALINNTGIYINGSSILNMYVRRLSDPTDKRLLIITAKLALLATLQLQFANGGQTMTGSLKINLMKLTKTYSRLNTTDQFTINELADLSRGMIEKMVQGVLTKGIPMPKIKGFSFTNPVLSLNRHFALINTYFEIDEDYVDQLIGNAVAKAVGN